MAERIPKVAELLDFTGRTAIVTGANGGIGAGIVRRFSEAGANVVVHYRSGKEGAESLARESGGKAVAIHGDLTSDKDVEHLMDAAVKRFGRIDVLVNNAARQTHRPLLDLDGAEYDLMQQTNVGGVFRCIKAAALRMKEAGGGAIVNIASISGLETSFGGGAYCPSKAAVIMLTRNAALEFGPLGIRVNAVAPGVIWREGIEQAWPDGVARYNAHVPLKRLGRADDVADACLYLASPAARWVSGTTIVVDGGVHCHPSY